MAVVLVAGCGGPREESVLRVTSGDANNDTITLTDKIVPRDGGGETHETVLRFNNRLVAETSAEADAVPADASVAPGATVTTYKPTDPRTVERNMARPWSIHIEPERFSTEEFDRLRTCYETNRSKIDTALLNPPFQQKRYIVRLIHAAAPSPPPAAQTSQQTETGKTK